MTTSRVIATQPNTPRRSKGNCNATQPNTSRRSKAIATQPNVARRRRCGPAQQEEEGDSTHHYEPDECDPTQRNKEDGGSTHHNEEEGQYGATSTSMSVGHCRRLQRGNNWIREQSHMVLLPPFLCNILYLGPRTHTTCGVFIY